MKVSITTPSRLHLGILDLSGTLGRIYGSVGVAIEKPGYRMEFEPSDTLEIRGLNPETTKTIVESFCEAYGAVPDVRINVTEAIPEHAGLGSGTQLAMAVGCGLARILDIKTEYSEIAVRMERGKVSGVGLNSFVRGGFVVDSGTNPLSQTTPYPIYHSPFPEEWEYVVAIPKGRKGLSGAEEKEAFTRIAPGSEHISQETCRIVLMKMLPALVERDITSFGWALTQIDRNTGICFSESQEGTHAGTLGERIMDHMLESGCYGAGQSSWGPAVYGLVKKEYAGEMTAATEDYMKGENIRGDVYSTRARNSGALIEVIP